MGPIIVKDLKGVVSSPAVKSFNNDIADARELREIIDNFCIESDGSIQGQMWNKVQSKLKMYSDAMAVRIDSAQILSEAIEKALNILIDYIGDEYTNLDYSLLPELERGYNQLQSLYYLLSSKSSEELDKSGEGLLNYYRQRLNEIGELIEKLRILKEKYELAESIIASAMEIINGKIASIGNITPSREVFYKI